MVMDFSGSAGAASDFDLLPKGQLAWAILNIRGVKPSGSGGQYIDCELTIDQGQPYAGRKLWDMIGDPNHAGNSEKYRQMGTIAITRILEAGRGASPTNPQGYQIASYADLDGLRVPIKIGIEEGEGGHNDKNRVAEWLTPNPASQSGHKWFVKLQAGEYAPPAPKGQGATGQGGFGNGAAPAQPAASSGFGNGFGNSNGAPAASASGFGNQAGNGPAPSGAAQGNAGAGQPKPATDASPSDPEATPGWMAQAGQQTQG